MAFTLAKASARSNSHRPSARPRPPADPVPELVRGVAMQHPGREARGVALAFDAHPRHSDLREFAERGSVERRATGREDDYQRFVIHRPHANAAGVSGITVPLQGGAIRRAVSNLGVDLRPLQLPGEVHVDHLGLRVKVVDLPPALAVPVAGLLHAAERQVRLGADRGSVDVRDAGVELAHGPEGGVHVARVEGAREPVLDVVVHGDVNAAFGAMGELDTGITYVNAPTIGAEAHLPFGGVKRTGNGHREGGWEVYDFYSETKVIYVDFSGKLQRAQIDTEI